MKRDAAMPPIGSDELAEGLMLVRATSLKMIRLQLAMERNDRRVALAAVDDLVALDRRLQDYLAELPGGRQLMFRNELADERAALNREKLTLAAEVIHGAPKAETVTEPAIAPVIEQVAEEPAADPWQEFEFEQERPRRVSWWLVAVLVVASAAAGSAYWLETPQWATHLAAISGALT